MYRSSWSLHRSNLFSRRTVPRLDRKTVFGSTTSPRLYHMYCCSTMYVLPVTSRVFLNSCVVKYTCQRRRESEQIAVWEREEMQRECFAVLIAGIEVSRYTVYLTNACKNGNGRIIVFCISIFNFDFRVPFRPIYNSGQSREVSRLGLESGD